MLEIFLMNCITFTRINKQKKEKNGLKTKHRKKFGYKKLRLKNGTSLKNKNNRLVKKADKKEPLKKLTEAEVTEFTNFITREVTNINRELF